VHSLARQIIRICHLYPRHMSLYGDRGNIATLVHRAKARGIEVQLQNCEPGEDVELNNDIIMLGGGQDLDQARIIPHLLKQKEKIKESVERGALFFGVCGGYQLLGKYYQASSGKKIEGLGLVDMYTESDESRIIGNLCMYSDSFGLLTGFENHAGRTFLNEGVKPLAKIHQGGGNNGSSDRTEGVFMELGKGMLIGTYMHGCLPQNPRLADFLLAQRAGDLYPLDDVLESLCKENNLKLNY